MTDLPECFDEEVLKNLQTLPLEQLLAAYKEGAKGNTKVLLALEKHLKLKMNEADEREAAHAIRANANEALRNVFSKLCNAYFTSVEIGNRYYGDEQGFHSSYVEDDDTDLNKLLGINGFRDTSTERAPTSNPFEITLKDGFLNKALGIDEIELEGEIPNDTGEDEVLCQWDDRCYIDFQWGQRLTEEHVDTLNYISNQLNVFEFVHNQDIDDETQNRYETIRRALIEKALLDVFEGRSTREELDKKMLFVKLGGYENWQSFLN